MENMVIHIIAIASVKEIRRLSAVVILAIHYMRTKEMNAL